MTLGALCVPLLTMTSGAEQTFALITRMLSIHAVVGIFEGAVTAVGLMAMCYIRSGRLRQLLPVALVCVTAALLTAVPMSSSIPDSYESAAISTGLSAQLLQSAENIAGISAFHAAFEGLQNRFVYLSSQIFPSNHALSIASLLTCTLLAGSVIFLVRRSPFRQSTGERYSSA